jgi:hypothetical protein
MSIPKVRHRRKLDADNRFDDWRPLVIRTPKFDGIMHTGLYGNQCGEIYKQAGKYSILILAAIEMAADFDYLG